MKSTICDNDEHDQQLPLDEKGNYIHPKRVYDETSSTPPEPQATVPKTTPTFASTGRDRDYGELNSSEIPTYIQRDMPAAVKARGENSQRIREAIAKAAAGDTGPLFERYLLHTAAGQLNTSESNYLNHDLPEAARIRDEIVKLRLAVRWDRELRAVATGKRNEIAEDKKRRKEGFQKSFDSAPIEIDELEWGAAEWGRGFSDSNRPEDRLEMWSRINLEFAVVPYGGTVRILQTTKDVRGNKEFRLLRIEDFHRLFSNISFNGDGKQSTASHGWERWKHRKEYAGIGFFPGSDVNKPNVPDEYFNLWKGFAVKPAKGDWGLFRQHLFSKVCQGNDAHYEWLMDWLAHLIQKPQEKPGACVVMKSAAEGTGKSMLATILQRILGDHVLSVSKPDQITGRFNGHLLRNLLLVCEEALWAGSKEAEGALKNLITEGELTIEQKGLDAYSAPNYSRLLMISNNDWVVPVGADPRRYFVLEVVNKQANVPAYFEPIFDQMKNGGTAAMLLDLLEWDITSNLRFAPTTDALREQRKLSLAGAERWLLDVAEAGGVRDPETGDRHTLLDAKEAAKPEAKDVIILCDFVRDAARKFCGPSEFRGLDRALGQLLKKAGVARVRVRGGVGKPKWYYAFPSAHEFAKNVGEELKVTIDGHEPGGRTLH